MLSVEGATVAREQTDGWGNKGLGNHTERQRNKERGKIEKKKSWMEIYRLEKISFYYHSSPILQYLTDREKDIIYAYITSDQSDRQKNFYRLGKMGYVNPRSLKLHHSIQDKTKTQYSATGQRKTKIDRGTQGRRGPCRESRPRRNKSTRCQASTVLSPLSSKDRM